MQAADYHITGSELLGRINEKGTEAFDQLFRELYAPLCLVANKYTQNEEAAKDIISELFLNLWKNKATLPAVEDVPTYLFIAAKYKSLDYLKHQNVIQKYQDAVQKSSDPAFIPSTDQAIFEAETRRLLYKAIGQLPLECKQVVLLSLDGFSTSEIAKKLNVTPAAVSNQKARAVRLLKFKIPLSAWALLCSLLS